MPAPCRASSLLLPPPSFVSFLSSTPPLRFCAPCTAAARPLPGPASDTPSGRAGLAMLCSPLLQSLCGLPPGARPSRSLPPRSALPRSLPAGHPRRRVPPRHRARLARVSGRRSGGASAWDAFLLAGSPPRGAAWGPGPRHGRRAWGARPPAAGSGAPFPSPSHLEGEEEARGP